MTFPIIPSVASIPEFVPSLITDAWNFNDDLTNEVGGRDPWIHSGGSYSSTSVDPVNGGKYLVCSDLAHHSPVSARPPFATPGSLAHTVEVAIGPATNNLGATWIDIGPVRLSWAGYPNLQCQVRDSSGALVGSVVNIGNSVTNTICSIMCAFDGLSVEVSCYSHRNAQDTTTIFPAVVDWFDGDIGITTLANLPKLVCVRVTNDILAWDGPKAVGGNFSI